MYYITEAMIDVESNDSVRAELEEDAVAKTKQAAPVSGWAPRGGTKRPSDNFVVC